MRRQADELLAEYRARLAEAREQAEEIIERARKAGETHERESEEEAKARREQLLEQTRRDIEAETRRAIQEIRAEVADLTVMATERVTRKVLTEEDQRRLVEETLARARLQRADRRGPGMSRSWAGGRPDGRSRRGLRARAVRGRQGPRHRSTQVHEQLGQFADALTESRDLTQFFFSPYFSVDEKKDALHRAVDGRGRRRS